MYDLNLSLSNRPGLIHDKNVLVASGQRKFGTYFHINELYRTLTSYTIGHNFFRLPSNRPEIKMYL